MKIFPNYKDSSPRAYIMGTLIRRREDLEYATEMLNEVGTTDMAIGDATAEIMITTPGKIPDEMYDLEETTMDALAIPESNHETEITATDKTTSNIAGFVAHSTLFIVLTALLLILLLICCITACVIARARKRFLESSDMECDIDCNGAKQPLITPNKMSETTSKSSAALSRN